MWKLALDPQAAGVVRDGQDHLGSVIPSRAIRR
ncbi:hypothetical protein IWX63_000632 [Arthrobacter sp. CAN_A2]